MEHLLTRLGAINNDRQATLSTILAVLRERREGLERKDLLYSYECDSLLLAHSWSQREWTGSHGCKASIPRYWCRKCCPIPCWYQRTKNNVRRQMQGYLGETSHFGRNVGKFNLLGTNVQNGLSIAVWTRWPGSGNKPSFSAKHFLLFLVGPS